MRIPKIKTKNIKKYFKKLPWIIGENAFFTFLILLFLALILGGIIFYKYNLVKKTEIQVIKKPLQFKEETYQEILKIWQEKGEKFQETKTKEYPNPLRSI